MSTFENVQNTNNQQVNNYNTGKIFVWNPRTIEDDNTNYENASGDDVTLEEGTLLGRIAATNKIVAHSSDASDGSQFPLGVLMATQLIPAGEDRNLLICVAGDVVEDRVILAYGDTMSTVISSKTLRDRIGSDTVGIKLVGEVDLTDYDNQP